MSSTGPVSHSVFARLDQAIALHQQGRFAQAESLYRDVLRKAPDQFDALHLLGVLEAQKGRHEAAAGLIRKALAVNSRSPEAYSNLGHALRALDRPAEALSNYDRALALKPAFPEALNGRGNALHNLGKSDEALASFERALALKPDYAEAFNNRGHALFAKGRFEDALANHEHALAIKPDLADALLGAGLTLEKLERYEDALACYSRALAIKPSSDAFNCRGNVHRLLQRREEALADYEQALLIKPDFADALYNHGNVMVELRRHDEIISDMERLLRMAPDYEYARGYLLYSMMHHCDWRSFNKNRALVTQGVRSAKRAILPFPFLAVSDSADDQLTCAQTYVASECPASPTPLWAGEIHTHDRIRVAYVSGDFRQHAMPYLMAGLFEQHDHSRFETIAISFDSKGPSPMRDRLQRAFDRFVDVDTQSPVETARLLRSLEVDIAVDLMGFTAGGRAKLFAMRPAPIQINYLGFPATMGAGYMDYILADRYVIPEALQAHYSEKVVYLPDTFQANDATRRIAETTPSRAEAGLPENGFVFCSFNSNNKITPDFFDIWMRLLQRTPNSVLWLVQGNAAVTGNLRKEAKKRGVNPDRLVFAPGQNDYAQHLARYRLADLFLDSLPFNAGTTASDALWAGLPVLTCSGSAFSARMAGSLLKAAGLPELITSSPEEYEALAIRLVADKKLLGDLKARLATNRGTCPLFNTDRFRRHIESAYITMWERYQRGDAPAGFAVQAIQ